MKHRALRTDTVLASDCPEPFRPLTRTHTLVVHEMSHSDCLQAGEQTKYVICSDRFKLASVWLCEQRGIANQGNWGRGRQHSGAKQGF